MLRLRLIQLTLTTVRRSIRLSTMLTSIPQDMCGKDLLKHQRELWLKTGQQLAPQLMSQPPHQLLQLPQPLLLPLNQH